MADETVLNAELSDTQVPEIVETPNPEPSEAVIEQTPAETPVELVSVSEPAPQEFIESSRLGASGEASYVQDVSLLTQTRIEASPQSSISENINSHLGGNEPLTPENSEIQAPLASPEVPVVAPEPVTTEAPVPVQAPVETTLVSQTEVTATSPNPEPVSVQIPTAPPTQTPEPIPQTPVIAETVASVATSIAVPVVAQTFTKSIRELFTKALHARQNKKRKKLDQIMSLFAKQTTITNSEVEKLLHVSDATATRYLSTLEKEGKIKQNGKEGKGVSYSRI